MAKAWETLNRLAARLRNGTGGLSTALGKMRKFLPSRYVIVPALIALWVLSGFYIIEPGQQGAVLRFGKLNRVSEPGFHYHLPRPIESLRACDVEKIQRYEIGTRAVKMAPETAESGDTLFLTSDGSLVLCELVIHFRVSSVENYLFKLEMPEKTVHDASLAALSTVIGLTRFDAILSEENEPGLEAQIGGLLQDLLDSYESGIQVVATKLKRTHPPTPVMSAFAQIAQAREQQRQFEAEALKYKNDLLPRTNGEAARIVQNAEAFKLQKVSHAQGEAERFLTHLDAYRRAKEVTRKRLYLEAAEQIVGQASKVVVASEAQMVWPPMPIEQIFRPADSDPTSKQERK
jgi:membrane protease subunit HflK